MGDFSGQYEKKNRHIIIRPHRQGCTCEACTGGNNDKENPRVSVSLQDGAVVVSAEYHLTGEYSRLAPLLEQEMEILAGQLEECGAIIGHIKAALEISQVEMFSLTERQVYRKKSAAQELSVKMAAILFAVEEEAAAGMVRTMLEEINRKVRMQI